MIPAIPATCAISLQTFTNNPGYTPPLLSLDPEEAARVSVYSHSRINAFENCPLQFKYRYIDRKPKTFDGVEAFVGKVVHEVLEALYKDLPTARKKDAAHWRSRFNEFWGARWNDSIRIVREGMTREKYRVLGERCVSSYVERKQPFDNGEVLGCEERVEFSLDEAGQYRMLGFVDRIDRVAPGVIEIHDYKTGSLPRAGALKKDRQLTLYEIALRKRWRDTKEVRQVWHYLAHDKEFTEQRADGDVKRVRLETIDAIKRIESTTKFPPHRTPLCGWCDYQAICPEWAAEREAGLLSTGPPPEKASSPPPIFDSRTGQGLLFGDTFGTKSAS